MNKIARLFSPLLIFFRVGLRTQN